MLPVSTTADGLRPGDAQSGDLQSGDLQSGDLQSGDLQSGDLRIGDLHAALEDPALNSMNFLNEIANRYPDAVSLAAGRPFEEFYELGSLDRYLRRFCQYLGEDLGYSEDQVRRTLFQYGRTKGIVHGLIAKNLAEDEAIRVDPESIVVTVGCQEAMFLVLRALRTGPSDVLLAIAPTYVGLTGAARLVELPVLQVAAAPGGIDFADLSAKISQARADGLRPRACYVMPDFVNPSGVSLDLADRRRLLEIAAAENILLLEDNPYGLFPHDDGRRRPTLKALDERRSVIYLGSFAKTALPGARVGYLVADQWVVDSDGGRGLLADQLSKLKSMLTVNTSPITQAIVGGKLLENDCSLVRANERERAVYTRNMRQLVDGLTARFPDPAQGVGCNVPAGGFFVVVTVPFLVDDALLERSAAGYGVLWTPMHHFYQAGSAVNALRLSCSTVTPEQIETGLDRLTQLINDELRKRR